MKALSVKDLIKAGIFHIRYWVVVLEDIVQVTDIALDPLNGIWEAIEMNE